MEAIETIQYAEIKLKQLKRLKHLSVMYDLPRINRASVNSITMAKNAGLRACVFVFKRQVQILA